MPPDWIQVVERAGVIGLALIVIYLFVADKVTTSAALKRSEDYGKRAEESADKWREQSYAWKAVADTKQTTIETQDRRILHLEDAARLNIAVTSAFMKVVAPNVSTTKEPH